MSHRRILSLWFPRLAAERALRLRRDVLPLPFAIVADQNGAQVLTSLNIEAEAAGLRLGQPLRDASAMCPALLTRAADPLADVLDCLAGGMSEDEILVDFPDLQRDDFPAVLAFAADRERRLRG